MGQISRRTVLSYLGRTAGAAGASSLLSCGGMTAPIIKSNGSSGGPGSYDVVVYGGTASGIFAAVAAARSGAKVALIEQTAHIGGVLTSGLGLTDSFHHKTIGGLSAKFFLDLGSYYGLPSGTPQYAFEPHVGEAIFDSYIQSSSIHLLTQRHIISAITSNSILQSITLDDGTAIMGSQWIDASYEGDLMAESGVSYTVGRESSTKYGESYAGWGWQADLATSPFASDGSLLPGVNIDPGETPGQSDEKIMAYSVRPCLTDNPANMVPFPMPAGYSPGRYAGLARAIKFWGYTRIGDVVILLPTINQKYCPLQSWFFSVDYPGASWTYPNANWTDRQKVLQDHNSYVAGLFYFTANDPSVPAVLRTSANSVGLAVDEFTDNHNWPWQMYVREGRRMIGQYVMTQSDLTMDPLKSDSIGVGAWPIDSHSCDRIAAKVSGKWAVVDDGLLYKAETVPYQLPFRAILPQPAEVTNLSVTVCMSASHIAFSSLRVEPTLMALGEAAGVAATLALEGNNELPSVSLASLQKRLQHFGCVIYIP